MPIVLGTLNARDRTTLEGADMPRFRSATITAGFDAGPAMGLLVNRDGAFTTNNLPLRGLIAFAYDLQDPLISGPECLDSERYSITARPEIVPVLPQEIDQFRLMVRELLTERFGLESHWDTRPTKALALRCCADVSGLKRAAASDPGPLLRLRDTISISVGNAALEPLFTSWLARRFGGPVVDQTGLIGNFNFELTWDDGGAETEPDARSRAEPQEPVDAALRHALEAQLGLTIGGVETDIEWLVVDRLRRPSDLEPRPIEVEIDPEMFDRYVGRYTLSDGSLMSVSREGTKLLSRLAGQRPVEIFPASETEFFAKTLPARVRFVVDDAGRARALVLHQGGRETRAHRTDYV